ncbi:hypothetical protein [Mycolicibacterium brisbanense]|uniref:hypothetical protein n=1 Tax=Mycolicibacterium brisbanense TaxID=146020 RepID=UPI000A6C37A6|nr:hypothetical protein [Mycolicibacterium brisbanense]MCV7161941.1 hypothetical protein [Mycolicibacterium brisbanense]
MAVRIVVLSFWIMVAIIGYATGHSWLMVISLVAFALNSAVALSRWPSDPP